MTCLARHDRALRRGVGVGYRSAMPTYPFTSALVTGASSGIGADIAGLLGAAGVPTVLVARRVDRLEEIAADHEGFEVLAADLLTREGWDVVAERVADPDRPIDLVVNNAGFGSMGTFHERTPDDLDDEVTLNVAALTHLSRVAIAAMVPRRRGYLLNISSVAGFQAIPDFAVYAATKAYVTSLTEAVHEEVLDLGIHVTASCPGLTRTEFVDHAGADSLIDRAPGFVWSKSHDVAVDALAAVVRNRTLTVPGALNQGAVLAGSLTPRSVTRRLGGIFARTQR